MSGEGFMSTSAQGGAALAVSLVILLVLTVLGIAGMRTTTLEEHMAGNTRDRHRAFEAAEAALRAAEQYIDSSVISTKPFDTNGSDGLYSDAAAYADIWTKINWNAGDSRAYPRNVSTNAVPRYVIQHYATVKEAADTLNLDNYGQGSGAGATELFRITARGTGGSDNTVVILQSTYGKKL
jgi:type IV pilus assembly protein PilX